MPLPYFLKQDLVHSLSYKNKFSFTCIRPQVDKASLRQFGNDLATTLDKTLETDPPVFQYQCHNWTLRGMCKLPPSQPRYNVVLAIILAHTNQAVVFKTTLKEVSREDTDTVYLCSSLRCFVNDSRKIWPWFQFVSSSFVQGCSYRSCNAF